MLPMRRFAGPEDPSNHGEYDELLTLDKKRRLRCFGHVSSRSAKTILQGTVKGKRSREVGRVDRNRLRQLIKDG